MTDTTMIDVSKLLDWNALLKPITPPEPKYEITIDVKKEGKK